MAPTTVGQFLINEALPEPVRDYSRTWDKKAAASVMDRLAAEHPDQYKDTVFKLHHIGHTAATVDGSSFSLAALIPPKDLKVAMDALRKQVYGVLAQNLPPAEKAKQVRELVLAATPKLEAQLYESAVKEKNPFALQVLSGSRGSKGDLRSLLLGDLMVVDHRNRVIDTPILHGYAQGLDPAEYWAASYGARSGTISTKFATQKAGFLAKQLTAAAHRGVISSLDCKTERGLPTAANDPDNIGTVLAADAGTVKAGTVLTPGILKALGDKQILVRSPLTCRARGGLCSKCVGIREQGTFPQIGDNVGLVATQALTEQLSQSMLSAKHKGGRASSEHQEDKVQGFDLVNQLVQGPESFREAAAIASLDGTVRSIQPAPAGGMNVDVDGEIHFIPKGLKPMVTVGDQVEEGQQLSEGIPNPAVLVQHAGIGDARMRFVREFKKAYHNEGLKASRRNVEILARGLLNHVRVTGVEGPEGSFADDILEYNHLESDYQPRFGSKLVPVEQARGKFLESPVLHHTIGTRIGKAMTSDLRTAGIKDVLVHDEAPAFQPEMVRAMETLSHSPDWRVRLGGSYLQRGILEGVHRGRTSERGTSYIPALAESVDFGKKLTTEGKY